MITRTAKLLLLCGIAVFYALVVFDNLTDFDSNYQFVRHVLMMDSTFAGNREQWRAIHSPAVHLAVYWGIIAWETATTLLLAWGCVRLAGSLRASARVFEDAKRVAIVALIISLLMWLVAFLSVGGEWFLMWQSRTWNGQEEAFRMFVIVALVLMVVTRPESETQP
jgi:predicted small integral membrane protein